MKALDIRKAQANKQLSRKVNDAFSARPEWEVKDVYVEYTNAFKENIYGIFEVSFCRHEGKSYLRLSGITHFTYLVKDPSWEDVANVPFFEQESPTASRAGINCGVGYTWGTTSPESLAEERKRFGGMTFEEYHDL